jgi:hypothetical protein
MQVLKQLQSQFQEYLMHGTNTISPEIAPDERFSADKRLKVYFDAYRIRLMEILKLDFPKTHTLLGDEEFEQAFLTYLLQFPSTHFSVRYFGQHFSQFLATTAPYSHCQVFAEMANFEWSISFTIDAKDAKIVTQQALAQINPANWPDLHFTFHPSVISVCYSWDTPQLWQHIDNEQPQRAPVKQETQVRWLLWRKGLRSLFQSCNPAEKLMYEAIQANASFGEICECLIDTIPEDLIPMTAAQTLNKWIHEEMISEIYQADTQ